MIDVKNSMITVIFEHLMLVHKSSALLILIDQAYITQSITLKPENMSIDPMKKLLRGKIALQNIEMLLYQEQMADLNTMTGILNQYKRLLTATDTIQ